MHLCQHFEDSDLVLDYCFIWCNYSYLVNGGIVSECLTVTSFSRNRHPDRCHWCYYDAKGGEAKKIPDKILGSTARSRRSR